MSAEDERFTLEVPAEPAYVGTARIFASTVARHFEVSDETVEDLKLAVSEACSRALAGDPADRLSIRVQRLDGRLQFEIDQGDVAPDTVSESPALSLELVSALFEDAEITASDSGAVLRFSVG
ncbi:MAG: ATP-binding protein [Actinomycetota bacterium]|nr:ATP-binding protein [Actinomycetota bacterium]